MMSPIVGRLMRNNPDLMLKIDYAKGDELIRQFKKNQLDVIIIPEVEVEFGSDLEDADSKFLLKEEMWLVGSGKEGDLPPQISLKELNQFPLVDFTDEFPGFNKALFDKLKDQGTKVHSIFQSANVGTLKRVIEAGLGWGFLPSHSIKKQIRSGRMNRIHVKDMHYEVDLVYYYKKNQETKALSELFFQTLLQQEKA
jgi:DNA-binding transcriptional LysR family regulator